MTSATADQTRLSPLRRQRLDTLVRAAIRLGNRDGVGRLDFAALTAETGVSRASLYRYFDNRGDLIHQSLTASLDHLDGILEAASAAPTGAAQVAAYVRARVAAPADRLAVVSETSMLSPAAEQAIRARMRAVHARIERMLRHGIADGSVRQLDAKVVARAIQSMLDFADIGRRWIAPAQTVIADELADLVGNGSARDSAYAFAFHRDVGGFSPFRPDNILGQGTADLRMEQILSAASAMFNARGVDNVTLEDVATRLGLTRGAIYHYFRDREDLLVQCLERGMKLYQAFVDTAEAVGRNGLEKSLAIAHLNTQALAGSLQPVMGWIGFEALAPTHQSSYFEQSRQLLARTLRINAEGLADGSRRPGQDSTVAARGGAYGWLPRWVDDVPQASPMALADEMCRFLALGIAAGRTAPA